MIGLILLILLMFLLMGFFAGSEMAFLSCNKLRLKHLADEGNVRAKIIQRFQQQPNRFLTAILVGTNLAHVTITSTFAYLMNEHVGISEEWVLTLMLAPFVIIFAESVPKDWFRQRADDFIYRFAYLLRWLEVALFPLSIAILRITDFLIALTFPKVKRNPFVTKDEFRYLVDESARKGVLMEHEKRLIHTILNLGTMTAGSVMTPLKEFPKLELTKKVADVKALASESGKPVVMVYEEIPEIIVGMIYVFDVLFEEDGNKGLKDFLRPPLFISEQMSDEKAKYRIQNKHS